MKVGQAVPLITTGFSFMPKWGSRSPNRTLEPPGRTDPTKRPKATVEKESPAALKDFGPRSRFMNGCKPNLVQLTALYLPHKTQLLPHQRGNAPRTNEHSTLPGASPARSLPLPAPQFAPHPAPTHDPEESERTRTMLRIFLGNKPLPHLNQRTHPKKRWETIQIHKHGAP